MAIIGGMDETDARLVERFRRENSQDAFGEIVGRYVDLVYSAARRQVRPEELAEEVAQSVFADLAKEIRKGREVLPLSAWLHVVTRRTAIDAIRRESRRVARERAAVEMQAVNAGSGSDWAPVAPLLDEALAELPALDRAAIILRYFENKSLREVGAALAASEDAAQKRVSRAVEELRGWFGRRGIAVGAVALSRDLSGRAVELAPLGLGGAISAAVTNSSAPVLAITVMTITQKIVVGAGVALLLGVGYLEYGARQRLKAELGDLQERVVAAEGREKRLREERNALEKRLAEAQEAAQAAVAVAAATPPAPAAAPEPAFRPPPSILKDRSTLADDFVEALSLTEAQREKFTANLTTARDRVNELYVAHATIEDGPDGTLVISVPQFAEGAAVYDEFMADTLRLVGRVKMNIFEAKYRGEPLARVLGNFGAGVRKISISRVPPGFDGTTQGIRLAPGHPGGYVAVDKNPVPNTTSYYDSLGLVRDLASGLSAPGQQALFAKFADRLGAMPFQGQ